MDYKNSDLPWCANCIYGVPEENGNNIYCKQIEGWRIEDDFCGLHEWRNTMIRGIVERKGNMRDRFDIDQVIKITGLGIRAEQADGGADFDVACQIAVKKLWKIKEYESLEEQNRLLKLPCAAGDTVHHLCTFKNGESEIIEMKVECVEPCGAIRQHKGVCEIWNVYAETDYTKAYFKFFDFGKTVFLTREEAEAALKELERGKGE